VDEEAFNLSVRKFLKQLGITAQREIELGVRGGLEAGRLQGDERLPARATVKVEGLDEEIVVEGEIALESRR
jgi:enamine deaminase RidA (YjgF/YER057c/UK114 family)